MKAIIFTWDEAIMRLRKYL